MREPARILFLAAAAAVLAVGGAATWAGALSEPLFAAAARRTAADGGWRADMRVEEATRGGYADALARGHLAAAAAAGALENAEAARAHFAAARTLAREALAARPLNSLSWARLAVAELALGAPDAARAALRRSVATAPYQVAIAADRVRVAYALRFVIEAAERDAFARDVRSVLAANRPRDLAEALRRDPYSAVLLAQHPETEAERLSRATP